ncbi:MAG: HAD family phosphatase [Candidatus Altiarchaeota archaeon]
MLNAVLFDLDGVLVDSESISSEASDKVLAEFGIVQTPAEKKLVFGRRTYDNYKAAIDARGLKIDPQDIVDRKMVVFTKMIKGRLKPLPGVLRLLGQLKDAGIKVAVVSSSPLERVNASLGEVGLILGFDIIVSGDCCVLGKPHPEPFLVAAEKVGVRPSNCVVVEDAEAGILAGKAAGMKVVGLRSPNTHGQDLSKADAIVYSLEEIDVKFLRRL